ncbi:MAG TPA: carboxypeptidase-like regulatory domain-containing protein [Terriglobales bacterium]|nr:carboxypeptidase-like regulatory domain-containing protein [Terriglobales bacterium]
MHRLAICVIVLALHAAAQLQVAKASPGYHISGTAVNSITGVALSKATVSIGAAEGGPTLTAVTASDGRFTFEKLKPGKYWLEAEGRGFSAQRFDQHEEFSTGIAVGPEVDSEHLVFRIKPDATITGIVTDDQNEPVVQANVMLFRTGLEDGANSTRMHAQTNTDDRGCYHFGHVPPGGYYIVVSAHPWYAVNGVRFRRYSSIARSNGGALQNPEHQNPEFDVTYPMTYYPSVTDPADATPIMAKPGDRLEADLELTAVPSLHVRVKDSSLDSAQAIGIGAQEKLFGGVSIPVPMTVNGLGHGEFDVAGVSPGQFEFNLQSGGTTPSNREEEVNVSDNSEIDLSSASTPASVSGIVQLDSGARVTNPGFVQLFNRASGNRFNAQVSAQGEFEFSGNNIVPGKYQVLIGGVPEGLVESISASGASVIGRELDIASGASVQLKIVVSHGSGRVDGTAMREGRPFATAMIVLVPQDIAHDSTLVRRDQSDSDGTFTLYNVLPGKYTVVAIQNGWDLPWMSSGVLQPYLKAGAVVTVVPHGKYKIQVNVQ